MQAYHGFLGAETAKNIGETSFDTHLTDYHIAIPPAPPLPPRVRQYSQCAGVYMTHIAFQEAITAPTNLMDNLWAVDPVLPFMCQYNVIQVENPAHAIPALAPIFPIGLQAVSAVAIDGQITNGFHLPWFHRVEATHNCDPSRLYHYYQHEARRTPLDRPEYKQGGKYWFFRKLIYGTQIQQWRKAGN